MKTQSEIASMLIKRFSTIYCYNCANDGVENICDECDRKSMNWQLSITEAENIAREIVSESVSE